MIKKSKVVRVRGVTDGAFKILVDKVTELAKTVEDDRKELLDKINALTPQVEEKAFKINAPPPIYEDKSIPKEWVDYAKNILGEDFGVDMQYTPNGMVSFSIIVPIDKSNTKKELLIGGKDIRSKIFSPKDIDVGIENFCELVAKNLGIK